MLEKQYHNISTINRTPRFPILIHVPLHLSYSIIDNLYKTLQAKVKFWNEPKQVMPKSEDLSRSLEINAIWTFDTEFPYFYFSIKHAHILLSSLQ